MVKKLTTKQAAERLGICPQRVAAKLAQGHFKHAKKCECGRTMLIPLEDIKNDLKKRSKKNEKKVGRKPNSK